MTSLFSEKELENYYRKEPEATRRAVLAFLRDTRNPSMVVFGARALNVHLPSWLDKETKDWDILSASDAEGMANKLEHMLDKRYGGDFFGVEPAVHPGTFRIRAKVTGIVVTDVSFKDRDIRFKRIKGINYATLEWLEEDVKKTIANPEAEYRRAKDTDTLQRIKVFKKTRRKTRGRSRPSRYIDGSEVDTSMRGMR